jgi:hypothetical protein
VSEIQDRPEHIKQIFVGRPGTPSEPLTRARLEREREKGGGGAATVMVSPCVLEMYRVQETSEWHGTLTRSIKRDLATEIGPQKLGQRPADRTRRLWVNE